MPLGGIDGPASVAVSPDSHWLATVTTPRRDPQETKALEDKVRSATDPQQRRKLMEELRKPNGYHAARRAPLEPQRQRSDR